MAGRTRRIGPIGTTTRLIAAAALLYLALFDGTSWGLRWYDAALGLFALPGLKFALALVARRRGTGPIRFTGTAGTMLNCALIVALLANPYTAAGAELFYCATLIVAAWRAQPGCEATVISNWILRRDDQIGCPTFSPIDRAEGRRARRRTRRHGPRTDPVHPRRLRRLYLG
jgi:hypothetical protein